MPHRVLVVDDEPDLELLISQRFRKRIRSGELAFSFACHGEDALDKLTPDHGIDVILTDINMPVMDGLTLLSRLQAHPLLRSVIVSAYGDMPNIRTALNRGAFDFVTKPIDFQDLELTLDKALIDAAARKQAARDRDHLASLKLYLPPQVASLIVESGDQSKLDGVIQNVTVLYADIRGFTAMSENMEAREVVALLSEFFTAMSPIIFQHDGTLDKFIGDCIMALFGAPVATDACAQQALDAAIEMQREMERINAARLSRNQQPFSIGIGLHCGPAVVGNIGSTDRVQYTAIGDTVNVASRLTSKAGPSQIVISENIRANISTDTTFQPLGEVELKGRANKLNLFTANWSV